MSQKKMNFVFFFPDEMRASSVSCYGNKTVQMPNYDRLAKEGVRFESCIVQNPVCSPSRCSLMTGLYVHNMGHRTLWHLLRPHEPSLFRYLKQAGYDIAWFGKNDLYSQEYLDEICDDIEEKRGGYKAGPSRRSGRVYGGSNPYSFEDPRYYSFLYDPIKEEGEGITLDENIARAVDFLESRRSDDKPFMLYLPTTMPHPPYNALEQFHNMCDPAKLMDEIIGDSEATGKPSFVDLIRKYRRLDQLDPEFFAKVYAVYLGMNSYTDLMLGQLLETLDRTGLSENTTVIVSSDHGDWAGDYGLVEKWPNAMDDDLVRVPLIIRSPGNKAGHVVEEQVELFDVMPTIMELAGLEADHTHFARSAAPQLGGEPGDPHRAVFAEGGYDLHEPHCFEGFVGRGDQLRDPEFIYYPKALQQQEHPDSICRTVMIRTLTHKLVKRTSGEHELYDLQQDPKELENRYNQAEYAGIRAELESRLLEWYLKTSDVVPRDDDKRLF
ncbi:sulfatase-like hydrolase/transferase [Paenibacillus sp. YN15]|uniref:sulfatase-like hydrolase/transferase n=1 Tax=Paenibacillus sp. YN15 TaxID=1742774 RepID=UPI000DCEE90B|nr:sulfatase-like hydrolase/transferase [Paenibacillus sp. YN15]RAU98098.1 sulfatase [Paenibacillus sp. YN15]